MDYGFKVAKLPEVTIQTVISSIKPRRKATFKGEVLPETTVEACPRIKVAQIHAILPMKYLETLEQNQLIPSCCRHPENHDIVAKKSHPDEELPDIYQFICTCGNVHTRFCVGSGDERPFWEVR